MTQHNPPPVLSANGLRRHPKAASSGCVHRWMINASNVGVCATCAERRQFPRFGKDGWHPTIQHARQGPRKGKGIA